MSETRKQLLQIFKYVQTLMPDYEFFLACRDCASNRIVLTAKGTGSVDIEKLLNTFAGELTALCSSPLPTQAACAGWIELAGPDEYRELTVQASYVGNDRKSDYLAISVRPKAASVTPEQQQQLLAAAGIFRDRFDDLLLKKSLRKSMKVLKRSSQALAGTETLAALTDMTSGMAHDFNNIIGGIIGRVQLMKLRVSDDSLLGDLNKIEKQLLEGARTVKSLQEFGTSTSYKKPKRLDLVKLITDYFGRAEHRWLPLSQKKNVTVAPRHMVDEAWVDGSSEDLATVLDKLIENAVEHSFENGSIEVTLEETQKDFRLSVADHGAGIDEQLVGKVFYPFYTTKQRRGAGLGLSIVSGIVGRHNGTSAVTSQLGSGSVFEINLPKAEGAREDSDITHKRSKLTNLRILVVDDDEQIREVLSDMLAISGHIVTTCDDGFDALEQIKQHDFDLVITDLGMAGMSGLDLAGLVHEDKPDIPVALITGWGSQLNHDEVALAGVKAVLAKPFHLEEINQLVEKLASPAK